MMSLLEQFSIVQILTFIVLLAAAIKGTITFFDWALVKMKEKVHKDEKPETLEHKLDVMEQTHCQHIDALKEKDEELQGKLGDLTDKIDLLIDSDKDDIKAWITEQYYLFKEKGYIDSYSLDCIEHRYSHYKKENGNSFIETLMKEIRQLPKQ